MRARRLSSIIPLFPPAFDERNTPELWIEVEAKARRIHLREKEPRLRAPVIAALSAST